MEKDLLRKYNCGENMPIALGEGACFPPNKKAEQCFKNKISGNQKLLTQ